MKSTQNRPVAITNLPLTVAKEEAYKNAVHDRRLIGIMVEYRKTLEGQGIEVFKRKENILVTEKGYYMAFYKDELQEITNDEDKEMAEKQYFGKDGRLKVKLQDKDGVDHELDVATMVAQQFLQNPFNFKHVSFKDGNPANCNASNLYWDNE
jgi:hypothetical protein